MRRKLTFEDAVLAKQCLVETVADATKLQRAARRHACSSFEGQGQAKVDQEQQILVGAGALMEVVARANNRQGFPVGAEYLRTASTGLRDTSVEGSAIPIAQALVAANAERAEDELGAQHPFLILLPGLAALGLLYWVNRQLAGRFRRRINLGIAAAFVTVGALTVVAFFVAAVQASNNDDLRDGSYDDVVPRVHRADRRPTTPRPTRASG